ncbi:MAG: response regulator [Anaeromyxobacteraceae bacterium]
MADRILVVDDRPGVADLVAAVLASYDVTRETDGARALERLATESFDVVVTDVQMPGVDGFEVLRAAKRASAATEVVVMTAFATVHDAVQAVKQGAYDYIEKPFDPDDVQLAVARALEHRRQVLAEEERRRAAGGDAHPQGPDLSLAYKDVVDAAREQASRDYLIAVLKEHQGCVTRAAKRAGMERESMHRVLRRYSIRAEPFKPAGAPPEPEDG